MKNMMLMVGAAAAVLCGASAALAGPLVRVTPAPLSPTSDTFAYISGGGASLKADNDAAIYGATVEGGASAAYNFTPELGVQGDVLYRGQQFSYPNSSLSIVEHDFESALHGFTRNEQYLLGAFVQYGDGIGAVQQAQIGLEINHVMAGAEAQAFVGDATLYAQIGAERYMFGSSVPVRDGYFANFEARYFLQPDFKIEAHVSVEDLGPGGILHAPDEASANIGVGAEYRLADSPLSLFVKYDYARDSFAAYDSGVVSNRILAGVKFNFDAMTLEQRDRTGASLKPFDSHALDYGAAIGSGI